MWTGYEGVPPADHVPGNRKERRAIAAVKRRIKKDGKLG